MNGERRWLRGRASVVRDWDSDLESGHVGVSGIGSLGDCMRTDVRVVRWCVGGDGWDGLGIDGRIGHFRESWNGELS